MGPVRVVLAASVLLVALLAGCAGDEDPVPAAEPEPEATEAPQPVFGPHSGLPRERPSDWRASLDAPPEWVLGEWWTIHAVSALDGTTYDITRVVAGKEGPDYLVGMPIDAFDDEIMVLHHPGMGLVQKASLGYETHDFLFAPLQFPLQEGDSWDSLWQSATGVVTHTVEAVDPIGGTAEIVMTGQQPARYTYDANLGAIRSFDAPGYMSWEVTGHGFDHEGTVRVPHSHDMTFFHGRLGPVVPVVQSQGIVGALTGSPLCPPAGGPCADAAPPVETINISEGYDRASFSIIILDLPAFQFGAPVTAGGYQVTATAPDGTVFESSLLPTDTSGISLETWAYEDPEGIWDLTTLAVGAGQAFIEKKFQNGP